MPSDEQAGNGSGNGRAWVVTPNDRSGAVLGVFPTQEAASAYVAENDNDGWMVELWAFAVPASGKFSLIERDERQEADDAER